VSRKIAAAGTVWGGSILLSRLIGLVREGVLGRTLGAGREADVYQAAFTVPDYLNYLLAAGALALVFIPIYAARADEARGWRMVSVVSSFLLVLLAAGTTALWFAMPELVALVGPGFDAGQRAELVHLTRILLPAQVFHVLGGLLGAVLQARDRHLLPALAPLVYNAGIVAGGLIGGRAHGAEGFAWGVLAGSALGPFALPLCGCLRLGLRWRFALDLGDRDLRTYLVRSLPIMLGFSLVVVDDWFLRAQGSLIGAGAVSTLSYAKNLMRVPLGVFGLAAGVAAYPTLARLVAEGRPAEMLRTLAATARVLLVLACAAEVVLTVAAPELVTLVYGQRRLAPEQVTEIAACLGAIALGLTAWSTQNLLARGFYALGETWLPTLLGTAVAAAAYPLYVAGRAWLGAEGLALASAAAVVGYGLLLAELLRRRTGSSAPRALFTGFLARLLAAGAAALLVGWGLRALLPEGGGWTLVLARAVLLTGASTLAFALVASVLGVAEVALVLRRLRPQGSSSP